MPESVESISSARSLLFVPGSRPDRFHKALSSGADAIVLDLEDSVSADEKPGARENVCRWLGSGRPGVVRINGTDSPWHDDDMAMLSGRSCAVMVPKATEPAEIADIGERLAAGSIILPLLETAAGILNAREICSASPAVVRAVFGNADLGAELGVDPTDRTALVHARAQIVLASVAVGLVAPVDGVTPSIEDTETLGADAQHAARLGFTGKLCVHPAQVSTVQSVFSPSAGDLQWARDVLAAAGSGAATTLNGQVIGKPVVNRAQQMLSRSCSQPRPNQIVDHTS